MRFTVAIAVVAITVSAAVFIHLRHVPKYPAIHPLPGAHATIGLPSLDSGPEPKKHPSWEDPVAVLLALGGVATAAGILTIRR